MLSEHGETARRFETHTNEVHAQLATTIADTAAALAAHSSTLHEQFAGTADQTISALASNAAALQDHFSSTAEQTAVTLATHMDALEQAFANTAERTTTAMEEHTNALQERFTTTAGRCDRRDRYACRSRALRRSPTGSACSNKPCCITAAKPTSGSIITPRTWPAALSERLAAFEDAIARAANDSDGRIGVHAERLTGTMGALEDTLLRHGNEVDERLDQHADRVSGTIGGFEEALLRHGTETHERLSEQAENLATALNDRVGAIEEAVGRHSGQIGGASRVPHRAAQRDARGPHCCVRNHREGNAAAKSTGGFSYHTEQLTGTLAERLAAFEAATALRTGEADERLGHHTEQLTGRLDDRLAAFESVVGAARRRCRRASRTPQRTARRIAR